MELLLVKMCFSSTNYFSADKIDFVYKVKFVSKKLVTDEKRNRRQIPFYRRNVKSSTKTFLQTENTVGKQILLKKVQINK